MEQRSYADGSNQDHQGEPMVVPWIPPAPAALDGHLVQVEVIRVVGG